MTKTTQESNYQYFMEADVSQFIGEWVAVSDSEVLAHGKNLKEVAEGAKKASNGKKFLLARIPSQEAMIF